MLEKIMTLSKNRKIYLVGAGRYGNIMGRWMQHHGLKWYGYIDKAKSGEMMNCKRIYSYSHNFGDEACFIISSLVRKNEMITELCSHGINQRDIISFNDSNYIYEAYNDIVPLPDTTKLKKFKNNHEGRRCFVIGNGPSLQINDLEKLKNEFTFASNSIYAVYDSTKWRPTYYCTFDSIFEKRIMRNEEKWRKIESEHKTMFLSIMNFESLRGNYNQNKIYFFKTMYDERGEFEEPHFSSDCSKFLYTQATITYAMLQLAVYMGFKEIYLLGMDFTFSAEKTSDGKVKLQDIDNHMPQIAAEVATFQDETIKVHGYKYVAEMDLQLNAYKATRRYCDKNGIKINNATRGGKLEVFERVDFDSLFD